MRAKPILSLTLLAAALGLPGMAASVGLGRMTLQSSLGQPLSAQIELTSVTNEDLGSLTARIADSSLYRQNGLTYQGVLSRARVAVERLPNGERRAQGHDGSGVVRAVSRLAGRGQLGFRPRRARLHVPPRSSGMPAAPAVEPVTPPRAGAARRRDCRRGAPAGAALPRVRAPVARRRVGRQHATTCGAATRCRGSPAKPSRRTRRSSRCWSRSSTAIRALSTAT